MEELLSHPAFQGGVAPFLVALVAAISLQRTRLAGIAILVAFMTCMYLVSGIQLTPLTATRKIVLLGALAAVIGIACDLALKPSRRELPLAALAMAGALWAFWPVLAQKPAQTAWLLGATAVVAIGMLVWTAQRLLADDGVRAGAATLGLGLGIGVAAIFSASLTYGLYGVALGAGAGGFLLPQMITGRKHQPGATFTFTAMVLCGLVAAGAMILAELPWYAVLVLALVPLVTRAPAPVNAAAWLQAIVFSSYALAVAALACILAWPAAQQT